MIQSFSFFVPWKAYLFQLAVFSFGLVFLLCVEGKRPGRYLLGLAFLVGFTVVGMVQWMSFAFGRAELSTLILTAVAIFVCGTVAFRLLDPGYRKIYRSMFQEHCSLKKEWVSALIFVGIIVGAYMISQSADLGESDPRWQWGFRAKILAGESGFSCPFFKDPMVIHTNPFYPLLYSAYEGFMLRTFHDLDAVELFRSIPVFVLISFFLIIWEYSRRNSLAFICAATVIVCLGRFWSLAVDENYIDFPLGVYALAAFIMLFECIEKREGFVAAGILSGAVIGLKQEGIIFLSIMSTIVLFFHVHNKTPYKVIWPALLSVFIGVGAVFFLHRFSLGQINTGFADINVGIKDMSFNALVQNLKRVPDILAYLGYYYFRPKDVGFLLIILALVCPYLKNAFAGCAAGCVFTYLIVMIVPFIFTQVDHGNYITQIQTVATRFFFQIVPLAALVLVAFFKNEDLGMSKILRSG